MTTKTESHPTKPQTDNHWQHIGDSEGCADHDHDLIHELSRRLDSLWRFDQFIANAESRPELQQCWRDLKTLEAQSISRLKKILKNEVQHGCF
jgi:hypothetical protein